MGLNMLTKVNQKNLFTLQLMEIQRFNVYLTARGNTNHYTHIQLCIHERGGKRIFKSLNIKVPAPYATALIANDGTNLTPRAKYGTAKNVPPNIAEKIYPFFILFYLHLLYLSDKINAIL